MRHYRCNLCNHLYPETDLIIDKESKQLLCKNCAVSMKELDDEQEAIEAQRDAKELREDEMKVKAGYFDKEGP